MTQMFSSAVLALGMIFCALTAVSSGLQPERFAAQLGLTLANSGGANEIRAQYAGFFLALAILCGASLAGAVSRPTALIALIVVFGGLFAGRMVSLALNRGVIGFSPTIIALYFIDAMGLSLSFAALALKQA